MFYTLSVFNIIHLACYLLGLVVSVFVAMSIDYKKFIKIKSNMHVYMTSFAIICALTFLIGEFLYNILTMFIQ
jgi:hypothetical protein